MTPRFATAAMIALWIMCGTVSAQTSPDVVQRDLKLKQEVSVIDEHGRRFRGRIAELSADAFTLAKGRNRTIVPYHSVVRIDEVDDLRKGMRIGMLAGLGVLAVEAWAAHEDGITLNAAGYGAFGLLYGGAGAAIGAGIDALIGGDRRVYQRSGSSDSRLSVAPVLGQSRVGVVIGVTW